MGFPLQLFDHSNEAFLNVRTFVYALILTHSDVLTTKVQLTNLTPLTRTASTNTKPPFSVPRL